MTGWKPYPTPEIIRLCLKRGLTLWRASRFADVFASPGEGQTPFQTEPSFLVKELRQTFAMKSSVDYLASRDELDCTALAARRAVVPSAIPDFR